MKAVLLFSLLLFLPGSSAAQGNETVEYSKPIHLSHVRGVVLDWSGTPISGARIEVHAVSDHQVLASVFSDARGEFDFGKRALLPRFELDAIAKNFDITRYTIIRSWIGHRGIRIVLRVGT